MNTLVPQPATSSPAEVLEISPEALEVANCYLQLQDIKKVAEALDIAPHLVSQYLARREVKAYVDHVFYEIGFNNRFLMRSAMDSLIRQKFQEMEEAGTGSNKDIADLLALSHKMSMELLDKQIALEKLKSGELKSQVNVQINDNSISDGTKYGALISKLLEMPDAGNQS
jgi:DNA-binding CsgD family transcriptional regulator